jgi:predicted secreted Zn-dependent protease
MGSILTGRDKTLTWSDFGSPVNKPKPAAGATAVAAHTEVVYPIQYGWSSTGKSFSLADNVKVNVRLDSAKSWVAAWVFNEPKQFQDDLLKHEQGHYDIAALLARDMFIEIMQLKGQTFGSKAALDAAVKAVVDKHRSQKVHDKYDEKAESNHGLNRTQQKVWDAYFQKAKTTARSPAVTAPDGALYKIPLLDVLNGAGKI